jgi:hypothetical protein
MESCGATSPWATFGSLSSPRLVGNFAGGIADLADRVTLQDAAGRGPGRTRPGDLRGRPVADIVPAGAGAGEDRLGQLIAEGRLVAPVRARPKRAPRLVKARRPASSLVLAERDAER